MTVLASINAVIEEILNRIETAKRATVSSRRKLLSIILRLIDQLDAELDLLVSSLAPEKLTDERFRYVEKQLEQLSKELAELRKHVINGRLVKARDKLVEIQEKVRHVYRILLIIRAPTAAAAQFTPEIELRVPPLIQFLSPFAVKIYNVMARRGEMFLDELVSELGVTDKDYAEFNKALQSMIQLGYIEMHVTKEGRLLLRFKPAVAAATAG